MISVKTNLTSREKVIQGNESNLEEIQVKITRRENFLSRKFQCANRLHLITTKTIIKVNQTKAVTEL